MHNIEKNYYELRAQETLIKLFGVSLAHSDKPDLISESGYGVEVTRAIDKTQEENFKFFQNKMKNKCINSIPPKSLKRFKKNNQEIHTNPFNNKVFALSGSLWGSSGNVINSIKNKIDIINRNNYVVSNVDLYVFTDSFRQYDEYDAQEIMHEIKTYQSDYDLRFKKIYLDDTGYFYVIDLVNEKTEFINTDPYLSEIVRSAKEKAMLIEKSLH